MYKAEIIILRQSPMCSIFTFGGLCIRQVCRKNKPYVDNESEELIVEMNSDELLADFHDIMRTHRHDFAQRHHNMMASSPNHKFKRSRSQHGY
jgi:hypothetical protein